MHYAPTPAIQTYCEVRRWSNPQRTFFHTLEMLDLNCAAYSRPGILILTNSAHTSASAMAVNNLRKELPKILEHRDDDTVAYWDEEADEAKRNKILVGLTPAPIFNDILAPTRTT